MAAAEAAAISVYWQSVWTADDDPGKISAANTALSAAVGDARAPQLIADYVPFNLADTPSAPLTKESVALSVAFVVFPPDPVTTQQSWTQAPQVLQFPDCFVVLGFNGTAQTLEAVGSPITLPLYTGPDPSADPNADPTSCIHPDGADLFVPDQLQWMVDFDRAVAAGMALAIPLTAEQYASGFTRLLVVGLQLSTAAKDGPAALQELLAHHQWSRSGFFLLPQGTPAHNATGTSAGTTPEDDADASFDDRLNRPLFVPVSDPTQKRDGQWLAEFLGLDPTFVGGVHASDGVDQMQARAMQTALWPATFGYWMDTLFTPNPGTTSIFSDAVIESTRTFFTSYVSGRGPLQAIRIAGQPYGILPTTAFSRIQWFRDRRSLVHFRAFPLYNLLRQLDADWSKHEPERRLGRQGRRSSSNSARHRRPHSLIPRVLLAKRRKPRAALQHVQPLCSRPRLDHRDHEPESSGSWPSRCSSGWATAALRSPICSTTISSPTIRRSRPSSMTAQLSETTPIRAYTPDNRNYIQWLIDAATQSLDALREETGFTNNQTPQALLYLMLRHALMLGYYNTSYNLHAPRDFSPPPNCWRCASSRHSFTSPKRPAPQRAASARSTRPKAASREVPRMLVSDFISSATFVAPEAADFAAQIGALEILVNASTAQLERAFAEHIDTCSYRYDAWLLGLVNQHIQTQLAAGRQSQQRSGLYLGAYAWVEDLHPSTDQLTPAQLPPDLAAQFPGTAI